MNIYIPYTYLIGWSKLNWWYYGVEFANNKQKIANPSNLWTIYFTSSKTIAIIRDLYGEPDVIQIRKTFTNVNDARNWENKVLIKMNVLHDTKWINQTTNKAIKYSTHPMLGKHHNQKSNEKNRQSNSGKLKWKNKKHPMLGKTQSQESNEKNRQSHLGKKRPYKERPNSKGKNNPAARKILIIEPDGTKRYLHGGIVKYCYEKGFTRYIIYKMCEGYVSKSSRYKGYSASFF